MPQLALVRPQVRAETAPTVSRSAPDYALLVNRLELLVTQGRDPDKAAEYLRRDTVWRALPPDQALVWSRLAQSAGLLDLALEVLAWLNRAHPDEDRAWLARLELLETLGRLDEAARIRALCPTEMPGRQNLRPVQEQTPTATASDAALDEPFVRKRREEGALARYLEYFQGRRECFARQWADKEAGTQGYVPVRRPLEAGDVLEHVQGRKTYGIYLLQEDNRVSLAVIDADLHQRLRSGKLSAADRDLLRRERDYLLTRLPELARENGLPCLTEFSGGKGYHFWFFFTEPVPAALPRQALSRLVKRIAPDISCFTLEVFPKQDQLTGKGLGNLVKLPLGVHRVTGKQSHFPRIQDRTPWAQMRALETMERISPENLERAAAMAGNSAPVLVHPRHQAWVAEYPELALLADRCPALGQIVVSCRNSRTLSVREEKIILGTVGFLPRAKTLVHHLFQNLPEYNPHLADYRLSRVRGTPLGCKRIHSLLNMTLDLCAFDRVPSYPHPLLHLPDWSEDRSGTKAERIENLQSALENLDAAMERVKRFI